MAVVDHQNLKLSGKLTDQHFQLQSRAFGTSASLRGLDGEVRIRDQFDSMRDLFCVAAAQRVHDCVAFRG